MRVYTEIPTADSNLKTSCSALIDLAGLLEFQRDHNSRAKCEPQGLPAPGEKML